MHRHEIYAEKPRKDATETDPTSSIEPATIENYLTDESRLITGKAEKVFFPRTEAHIAKILSDANKRKIRVTISGAGTGITGSRVPQGGIVLATEKMTKVAGVADVYSAEELVGKKLIVIVNLKPAVIRGIESQGMLLAAEVEGKATIPFFDKDVLTGAKVR